MPPEMGRAFFRIAFFVTLVSAVLLPFLSPGTAEFVVDLLALGIGFVFIGIVAFFARWSARR
jgi:preprotein translocase subunit Sss1